MKNKLVLKLCSIITLIFIVLLIILSILGNKERVGYLTDFKLIKESSSPSNFVYSMRIRYYDKTFRNSDIYGVYPVTNNLQNDTILPYYIKNISFKKGGSPYGKVISEKEINSDEKIDVGYKLKIKLSTFLLVYSILVFLIVIVKVLRVYKKIIFNFIKNLYIYKKILLKNNILMTIIIIFILSFFVSKDFKIKVNSNIFYTSAINILIWIYASLVFYLLGSFILNILERVLKKQIIYSFPILCLIGLVTITAILQIISLFFRIWIGSFIFVNVFCIITILIDIDKHKKRLVLIFDKSLLLFSNPIVLFLIIIFGIKFLYYSTLEPMTYDSYLYHTQNMIWIEKYGTVFGLGNIHGRLAFGSSWLLVETFFAMSFILKIPFHAIHNFIGFVFCIFCIENISFKNKKNYILSFFSITILILCFYEQIIFNFNTSTDMIANWYYIVIVSLWIKSFLEKQNRVIYLILIIYLSAFSVTAKVSMAPIVLLATFSFIYLVISQNKYKKHIIYTIVILGLFVSIPFLIRNIIQSGYLIYPFPSVDIFNVDWKLPIESALSDKNWIVSWARKPSPLLISDYKLNEWFPIWWENIKYKSSFIFSLRNCYLISLFLMFLTLCISFFKLKKDRFMLNKSLIFYPLCILCFISAIFWFFSAPDYRFALSFWFVLFSISLSKLLEIILNTRLHSFEIPSLFIFNKNKSKNIFTTIFSLFIIFEIYAFLFLSNNTKYIEYRVIKTKEVYHKNIGTYYLPIDGDQSGYNNFPAVNYEVNENIYLRGKNLKSGFKYINNKLE